VSVLTRLAVACGLFLLLQPNAAFAQRKGKRNEVRLPSGALTPTRLRAIDALFYDAVSAQAQGKRDQAIALYLEIVGNDSSRAAAHYGLGTLYLEGQRPVEALPWAQRAYRLDPSNKWYAFLVAAAHQSLRQHDQAEEVLKQQVERYPNDLEIVLRLADAHLQQSEIEPALELYNRVEQRTGLTDDLALMKYRIFMGTRQYTRGVEELKRYVREMPTSPRNYFLLYDLQTNAEQFDSAIATIEALRAVDPNNDQAPFILADFYLKRHQTDKAAELLNGALGNPLIGLPVKLQFLEQALARYRDPFERVRIRGYLALVDATHPGASGLLLIKARTRLLDGQPDSARVLLRQAVERDESSLQAWSELVTLDAQRQAWHDLRQTGDEALAIFPGNWQFLFYRAVACYQLKDYRAATASLEEALPNAPEDDGVRVQLHTLLGDSYHYLDAHEQSDASYEKALSIDPDNALVLNNYAYFLSVRRVNLDRAKAMIQRVMRDPTHAQNASYQDTYGWILYQLGDYREAQVWIERAYRQEASAEVAEHLGDVLAQQGEIDRATKLWQEALTKLSSDDSPITLATRDRLQRKLNARKL